MSFFFTADQHFGHENIIKHCNRPFIGLEEMDRVMAKRWNGVVTPQDTVYHMGDLAFHRNRKQVEALVDSLNGRIHLIVGNHDHTSTRKARNLEWVGHYDVLKFLKSNYDFINPSAMNPNIIIALLHYPMRTWDRSHYGSWHLHGHHHGGLPEVPGSLSFDVGADAWDFTPVSFKQVYEKMLSIDATRLDPGLQMEREKRG